VSACLALDRLRSSSLRGKHVALFGGAKGDTCLACWFLSAKLQGGSSTIANSAKRLHEMLQFCSRFSTCLINNPSIRSLIRFRILGWSSTILAALAGAWARVQLLVAKAFFVLCLSSKVRWASLFCLCPWCWRPRRSRCSGSTRRFWSFVYGAAIRAIARRLTIFNAMLLYNITSNKTGAGNSTSVKRVNREPSRVDARIQSGAHGFSSAAFLESAAGGGHSGPFAVAPLWSGLASIAFLGRGLVPDRQYVRPVRLRGLGTPDSRPCRGHGLDGKVHQAPWRTFN